MAGNDRFQHFKGRRERPLVPDTSRPSVLIEHCGILEAGPRRTSYGIDGATAKSNIPRGGTRGAWIAAGSHRRRTQRARKKLRGPFRQQLQLLTDAIDQGDRDNQPDEAIELEHHVAILALLRSMSKSNMPPGRNARGHGSRRKMV